MFILRYAMMLMLMTTPRYYIRFDASLHALPPLPRFSLRVLPCAVIDAAIEDIVDYA